MLKFIIQPLLLYIAILIGSVGLEFVLGLVY